MTSTSTTNTGTDANYSWKKDYVYRDGLLLAAITGTDAEHFHLDHLGTPRLITYLNGTATAERHDYYPFGEEVTLGGNEEMKFTGHERDSNSGLDYMHARFDDAAVGRFLSVDRHMGSASRPLSWNRYSYATNNSITKLDPLGNVEVHFTVMTWIPSDRVTFMGRVFAGDGPGGFSVARSYRTRQDVTLETDPRVSANPIVANNPKTGRTFEFSGSTLIGEGHADAAHSMSAEAMRLPGGYTLLKMSGNIKNPLASLAPGITYEYYAIVDSKGKLIGFVGQHDGFPSHGASMQTDGSAPQTIFDDPATTMGPWGLFPFTPSTSVIDMWLNGSVSIDGISLNASPRY